MRRFMLKVALTGNVASGKSSVAGIWSDAGVPVIRADDLARDAVAPGTEGLHRIVEEFGPGILHADGSLHRPKLRERVFHSPEDRFRLEAILHPIIGSLRARWEDRQQLEGSPLIVAEIPLLFEVGLEKEYHLVVLVLAPERECLRRLTEDRGLEEGEARRVMDSQIPSRDKVSRADFILENGGSREDLETRALALLDLLRARARSLVRGEPGEGM
jgi:dephospho-CoA kinase